MGTVMIGWVEVKANGIWTSVLDVNSAVIRQNYDMFDILFGGRCEVYEDAIAGLRGTPNDHSDLKNNYGYGPSWIGWNELKVIDWSEHEDYFTEDWRRLFDIMDLYSQVPIVTDVRLIVGFG